MRKPATCALLIAACDDPQPPAAQAVQLVRDAPRPSTDSPCKDEAVQLTGFMGRGGWTCQDARQSFSMQPDGQGHTWAICSCPRVVPK